MRCPFCGADALVEGAAECAACGAPLVLPAAPEKPEAKVAPPVDLPCPDHPREIILGTCARCGTFVCPVCAPDIAVRLEVLCGPCRERDEGVPAIGGWLLVVGAGLVATPLILAYVVLTEIVPMMGGDLFRRLTTPGSPEYHRLWEPLLWFELVANGALIVFSFVATALFVQQRRMAPAVLVGFFLAEVAVVFAAAAMVMSIPQLAATSLGQVVRDVALAAIRAGVWIPYLLFSSRVKRTFVL